MVSYHFLLEKSKGCLTILNFVTPIQGDDIVSVNKIAQDTVILFSQGRDLTGRVYLHKSNWRYIKIITYHRE